MSEKKKAVILDASTVTDGDVSLEPLTSLCDTEVYAYSKPDEVAERIKDAEIVLTNKCMISREVFEKCPNLKFVGVFATGYNNVDVAAAKERGAVVSNVPGYSTSSVAQHTFALILHHYSSVSKYSEYTSRGEWCFSKLFTHFGPPLFELSGKTIGIIGYGAIGKAVAKIALAFGMNVAVCTRTPPENRDGIYVTNLEQLLKMSDIVTLHCPLTPETEKLINEKTLSLMKNTALLINTSRGGTIDEPALRKALDEGKIAGFGADVLTVEPMDKNCPLLGAKNCFITPHIAWAPLETRIRLVGLVRENLLAYLSGEEKNNVAKR